MYGHDCPCYISNKKLQKDKFCITTRGDLAISCIYSTNEVKHLCLLCVCVCVYTKQHETNVKILLTEQMNYHEFVATIVNIANIFLNCKSMFAIIKIICFIRKLYFLFIYLLSKIDDFRTTKKSSNLKGIYLKFQNVFQENP